MGVPGARGLTTACVVARVGQVEEREGRPNKLARASTGLYSVDSWREEEPFTFPWDGHDALVLSVWARSSNGEVGG